jgi:ATP-dependent Clp protease protease subunit
MRAKEVNLQMKNKRFWNWANEEGSRTLYINGVIAEESWCDDEVTPKQFKAELNQGEGDIEVWIHSMGGNVFAASQIYNMLMEYKGSVTVKIDGIAASAASVVAMAGTEVLMSPASLFMIHEPWTVAIGGSGEMLKTSNMLDEIKESIINCYELKTGLARDKISDLMADESWMNANKAIELGFADGLLFDKKEDTNADSLLFSEKLLTNKILNKLEGKNLKQKDNYTTFETLNRRLYLIKPN